MSASAAQFAANQANSARSTGPKTEEGKARSRGNALKHGLTGDGVVIPEGDVAEVERLSRAYSAELHAGGEVERTLTHRMAVLTVRMKRSEDQETAALSQRVRDAVETFEVPEGIDPVEADRLRGEAARRAMFDPSKEATLARKYEAAAERGFFKALKELRQHQRTAKTVISTSRSGTSQASLGSFLPVETMVAILETLPPQPSKPAPSKPTQPVVNPSKAAFDPIAGGTFHVPIAIGRAR